MDDERRWNSAPQYEKTVEDSNVLSYASGNNDAEFRNIR